MHAREIFFNKKFLESILERWFLDYLNSLVASVVTDIVVLVRLE